MKTQTLSMHAGLFWTFHSLPNSDMDYRIFNMHMWSFNRCMNTGDLSLLSNPKDFCRVSTEFDSGEILRQAQSLAPNSHPTIWWPCSIVLNFGFQELILLLCFTESLYFTEKAICGSSTTWPTTHLLGYKVIKSSYCFCYLSEVSAKWGMCLGCPGKFYTPHTQRMSVLWLLSSWPCEESFEPQD